MAKITSYFVSKDLTYKTIDDIKEYDKLLEIKLSKIKISSNICYLITHTFI